VRRTAPSDVSQRNRAFLEVFAVDLHEDVRARVDARSRPLRGTDSSGTRLAEAKQQSTTEAPGRRSGEVVAACALAPRHVDDPRGDARDVGSTTGCAGEQVSSPGREIDALAARRGARSRAVAPASRYDAAGLATKRARSQRLAGAAQANERGARFDRFAVGHEHLRERRPLRARADGQPLRRARPGAVHSGQTRLRCAAVVWPRAVFELVSRRSSNAALGQESLFHERAPRASISRSRRSASRRSFDSAPCELQPTVVLPRDGGRERSPSRHRLVDRRAPRPGVSFGLWKKRPPGRRARW
jgi:hypothetical protein